jgi:hypothetical protein
VLSGLARSNLFRSGSQQPSRRIPRAWPGGFAPSLCAQLSMQSAGGHSYRRSPCRFADERQALQKELLSAVMRAFMLEHEIAPQAPTDRLRWRNLPVVEKILPPHPAPERRFSMAALPARHPLQNGASAPKTRQCLRTREAQNRVIREWLCAGRQDVPSANSPKQLVNTPVAGVSPSDDFAPKHGVSLTMSGAS